MRRGRNVSRRLFELDFFRNTDVVECDSDGEQLLRTHARARLSRSIIFILFLSSSFFFLSLLRVFYF